MAATDSIIVLLDYERGTKRTYVFKEIEAKANGTKLNMPVFETIYVKQHVFTKGQPKKIKLTLELVD